MLKHWGELNSAFQSRASFCASAICGRGHQALDQLSRVLQRRLIARCREG